MKKRKVLVSLLCAAALLGVSTTALTSCKKNKDPDPTTEVEKFVVNFNSKGGSNVAKMDNVESGAKIQKPENPTRANYTFAGWYKDSDCTQAWNFDSDTVTANITLYAKWTAKGETPQPADKFTVNFDAKGGSAVDAITDVESGAKVTKPSDPTKNGYRFDGWYKSDPETDNNAVAWNFESDTVTATTTLYAKWTATGSTSEDKYTVNFDSKGGSAVDAITDVESGAKVTKPTDPTKNGYRFDGWYKSDPETDNNAVAWNFESDTVTATTTLYAKWTAKTPYELFIEKGEYVYASDFLDAEETIIDVNVPDAVEKTNTWLGRVSNDLQFSANNGLVIQDGKLKLNDAGAETTSAFLNVDPIYSSVIEIETTIIPVELGSKYTLFSIKSDDFGTIADLRTGGDIAGTDAGKLYYRVLQADGQMSAVTGDGMAIVKGQPLNIKITLDTANYTAKIELSQGANSIVYEPAVPNVSEVAGTPLDFSGVQLTTSGKNARPIEIEWLGIRVVSENVEALKSLMLEQIQKEYDLLNTPEYSKSKEEIDRIYNDGIAALEGVKTNAELLKVLDEIDFSSIHSDAELENLAYGQTKIEALETLKTAQAGNYTITKTDKEDYLANKEDFDNLFANAIQSLQTCTDKASIDEYYNSVLEAFADPETSWLKNDTRLLTEIRGVAYQEINQYFRSYDETNPKPTYFWHLDVVYGEENPKSISQILETIPNTLLELTTKADILAAIETNINAITSVYPNDATILTNIINEKSTEVNTYQDELIATWTDEKYNEVKTLIATEKENVVASIASTAEQLTNNIHELVSNINEYVGIAKTEIDRLVSTAGKPIDEQQTDARNELRTYIDDQIANYSLTDVTSVVDRLNAVYTGTFDDTAEPVVNEWANLDTTEKIKNYLATKKSEVDAIIEEYEFEQSKPNHISNLDSSLTNIKKDTQSNAVKEALDALADNYKNQINEATVGTDLTAIVDEASREMEAIITDQVNRSFTVTYDNAEGSLKVNYGQPLNKDNIVVTGMIVSGVEYESADCNGKEIYDDIIVHLVLEADPNFSTDPVNWVPVTANDGQILELGNVSTKLFDLHCTDSTVVDVSCAVGTNKDGTAKYFQKVEINTEHIYQTAARISVSTGESSINNPYIIVAKADLKTLKAYVKLAGSNGVDGRSGSIHYSINDVEQEPINSVAGIVSMTGIKAGDTVKIWAENTNQSGGYFYLAGVDAEVNTDAVPKTITITWNGLEMEPQKYSHIDTIVAPNEIPVGDGAFQYWYYLDENSEKIELAKEGIKFPINSNITFYAEFAQANVNITYVNGAETTIVPYSVTQAGDITEGMKLTAAEDEEFVGWYTEDGTLFDFTSIGVPESAPAEYTVYAKWYDLKAVTKSDTKSYDCTTAIPTTDNEVLFPTLSDGKVQGGGYQPNGAPKDTRNIRIHLASSGTISAKIKSNDTTKTINVYIDNVVSKVAVDTYGMVTLNNTTTEATLTSSELAAGDYYINWDVKNFAFLSITVTQKKTTTVKYSGISGTPVTDYTAGSELTLDLTGLKLDAVDASNSVDLESVKNELTIVVSDAFYAGTAGEYDVTISYGKHCSITYKVNVA